MQERHPDKAIQQVKWIHTSTLITSTICCNSETDTGKFWTTNCALKYKAFERAFDSFIRMPGVVWGAIAKRACYRCINQLLKCSDQSAVPDLLQDLIRTNTVLTVLSWPVAGAKQCWAGEDNAIYHRDWANPSPNTSTRYNIIRVLQAGNWNFERG